MLAMFLQFLRCTPSALSSIENCCVVVDSLECLALTLSLAETAQTLYHLGT
jgi:hypothetical protein